MDRGDAYREKGDLSKAMEDYKKALTLNPSDERKARIENALSNAYVDRGVDQKEASAELADYDEALRINPNNVVGLNTRILQPGVEGFARPHRLPSDSSLPGLACPLA
jgi:tetratricopeptide (TPR) repeat protein